jgi:hypothetical protein
MGWPCSVFAGAHYACARCDAQNIEVFIDVAEEYGDVRGGPQRARREVVDRLRERLQELSRDRRVKAAQRQRR